jgi:hypothetical protein
MFAAYLKRGVQAGLAAGLVFGLLLALVANPLVAFADELGHDGDAADRSEGVDGDQHAHDSAVSIAVTNGVSVVSGVLWGVLLGGIVFGIAYYFLEPTIPGTGATKSYLLAAAGFVTVSGGPWLVLPPQPPGVEQALSTETRILVYGATMVVGALVCLLAGFVYDRLRGSHGRVTAAVVATVPLCLLVIPVVLSPVNATEAALPPELATGLTGLVVFGQALLWLLLGGVHARLRRRSASPSRAVTARVDETLTAD